MIGTIFVCIISALIGFLIGFIVFTKDINL